jgi:uncharacterized membrane protein HdeD (DUF308 family)
MITGVLTALIGALCMGWSFAEYSTLLAVIGFMCIVSGALSCVFDYINQRL